MLSGYIPRYPSEASVRAGAGLVERREGLDPRLTEWAVPDSRSALVFAGGVGGPTGLVLAEREEPDGREEVEPPAREPDEPEDERDPEPDDRDFDEREPSPPELLDPSDPLDPLDPPEPMPL